MNASTRALRVVAIQTLLILSTLPSLAQVRTSPALWLHAGRFEFDLSGVGDAAIVAVRGDVPLTRVIVFEGGLAFTRTNQQFDQDISYLVPEFQFQAQWPDARFRPYVGIGAGVFVDLRRGDDESGNTYAGDYMGSLGFGARWIVYRRVGLKGEVRVRGMGEAGSSMDLMAGLGWSL